MVCLASLLSVVSQALYNVDMQHLSTVPSNSGTTTAASAKCVSMSVSVAHAELIADGTEPVNPGCDGSASSALQLLPTQ
jgi:hypothetical protein